MLERQCRPQHKNISCSSIDMKITLCIYQGKRGTNYVVLDVVNLMEYASEHYPLLAKQQAIDVITFPRNVRFSNSY